MPNITNDEIPVIHKNEKYSIEIYKKESDLSAFFTIKKLKKNLLQLLILEIF